MEKSVKVSVTLTDKKNKVLKGKDGKDKVQVLDRSYVEKFNAKNKKTGKQYVISEEKTKAYYKSAAGKVQAKRDKQESDARESSEKRATKSENETKK